jgi:hypothetical protein
LIFPATVAGILSGILWTVSGLVHFFVTPQAKGASLQVRSGARLVFDLQNRGPGGGKAYAQYDGIPVVVQNQLPDGLLLRDPGGEIDVVYGGGRFHIPNMTIFNQMGYKSANVCQLSAGLLAQFSTVPVDGTLLRDPDGEIDVVQGGKRYHIPNMTEFNARGYQIANVHQLWSGGLSALPSAPWPPP